MIVFYSNPVEKRVPLQLLDCNTACAANCLKPKSKCCNKYKKKGVNCKRCPNVLLKFAS